MTPLGWAILGYLALQLLVTAIIGKYFIKTETDFLLANRSLGTGLAAMSIFATWFGAESVMASSGAVAAGGLFDTRAEPFGYVICLILMALLLATRMREGGYVTMADLYEKRFSRPAAILAVLVMIPISLVWAAAQLTALSSILSSTIGLSPELCLVMAAAFVIIYTSLSGLLGDVVTDNIEGAVVMVGLTVMLCMIVHQLGGFDAAVNSVDMAKLTLIKKDETWLEQTNHWAVPIVGSLVTQEIMSRMLATKSAKTARNACFLATAIYLTVGLIPICLGLLGVNIMPVPENKDEFLPVLAQTVLPLWMHVLFLGALVSAILSTINSNLLAVSALAGHNLIAPMRPKMTDRGRLQLERGLVVAAGVATYFVSTAGDSIYHLVELSSALGSAGLITVLLFGLWTKFGGPYAAMATIITGITMTICGDFLELWDLAYLRSLLACLAVYVGVAMIERNMPQQTASA